MRKNLTKKLFLSVLTLAFAVISLGASTYAWFTMSKEAAVDPFKGTVGTGVSGLEICATPIGSGTKHWQATTLKLTDTEQLGTLLDDVKFSPVQAVKSDEDAPAESFAESLKFIDYSAASANQDYIAFELHFKLSSDGTQTDKTVYLKNYSITTNTTDYTPEAWYVNHDYTLPNGDEVKAGDSINSYRVSDAAYVALVGDSGAGKKTDDDNKTYVLETENLLGGAYSSVGKQEKGAWDLFTSIETDSEAVFPSTYIASTYNANQKLSEKTDNAKLCVLNEANGYEATVRVYVWIDGWDGECLNAIFKQVLEVNFEFTTEATKTIA